MPYLEELQEKHQSTVFKLKLDATYYIVMNDAIEVTYDLEKVAKFVGNKAKGWILKQAFQENKARQISWKTNIPYPLRVHIRGGGGGGGVRNVRFVFLIEPGHGKNLHPSTVCIEYDHELEKAALMQYNNYGMEGPDINIFSKT